MKRDDGEVRWKDGEATLAVPHLDGTARFRQRDSPPPCLTVTVASPGLERCELG